MSLVLSLRKDQDFYLGDERFVVCSVASDTDFTIRRCSDGKDFQITDKHANEVLPDVMIASGDTAPTVRLSIDAPQDIIVLRGDKYRDRNQQGAHRVRSEATV